MRKAIDIIYIVILVFAAILILGRDVLFREPTDEASIAPTPVMVSPQTHPPVLYDPESNAKMLELVENRVPLSPADQTAKTKLMKRENPIRTTNTYSMEYISSADEFLVEIRTIDIQQAKEESVAWLMNQGVSKTGVCHLPVVYYLNREVAENLRDMNIRFNPLPPGC